MKKINFLIKEITKNPKISEGFKKIVVRESVYKILGKNLLKYIDDIYLIDNKVFLKLNSSTLRSELNYSKKKLLENINSVLVGHKIDEIIIK